MGSRLVPMARDEENDGRWTHEGLRQVDVHAVRGYARAK